MKLGGLTFVLNERCNYRCAYCYKKLDRKARDLDPALARRALDSLWPHLSRDFALTFAGGEPLLSWDVIRNVTDRAEAKAGPEARRVHYALTTNGSLVSSRIIDFLAGHRFGVTLSFDGLAQDAQRRAGSFERIRGVLEALRAEPRISVGVHSVFTPASVGLLSRSLGLLMDWGVPRVSFSLSLQGAWQGPPLRTFEKELSRLRRAALEHSLRTGRFPLEIFNDERPRGVFACAAGRSWLSLSPDGRLWGCSLFADLFRGAERTALGKAYCYGSLGSFRRRPDVLRRRHAVHYARLSQDNFRSPDGPCFLCPELERCAVCPAAAALSGSPLGTIPKSLCETQKIRSREVLRFQTEIAGLGLRSPSSGNGLGRKVVPRG